MHRVSRIKWNIKSNQGYCNSCFEDFRTPGSALCAECDEYISVMGWDKPGDGLVLIVANGIRDVETDCN